MNRESLEEPFSPQQIKQRVGNFGQTLDYIEGHAVIQRLNDAFEGKWSFHVKSHEILETEVVVLGELMAEGIIKMQFGSSSITRAKHSGEIISLADDLKAASTDSLKKCATMFGVGLHLYSGNCPTAKPVIEPIPPVIENDPFSPNAKGTIYRPYSQRNVQLSRGGNGNGQGVSGGNGETGHGNNGRISQKQHAFLLSLAEDRNVGRKQLDEMSKERFGVVVNFLTKADASSFIGELTSN